jgi:hypothetical protein
MIESGIFSMLHLVIGLASIYEIYYLMNNTKYHLYVPLLLMILIAHGTGIAYICMPLDWVDAREYVAGFESVFIHLAGFGMIALNFWILRKFSFLFHSLKDWVIDMAQIIIFVLAAILLVLDSALLMFHFTKDPLLSDYTSARKVYIAIISILAVALDNIEFTLILTRIHQEVHRKFHKLPVAAAISSVQQFSQVKSILALLVILDWYQLFNLGWE